MADPFSILVSSLESLGFFGYLLPFILVFTLTYAILLKKKWVENNRIIGVISLVVAFFVLAFGGPALGSFLTNLFGAGAVIMAGILIALLIAGLTGKDITKVGDSKAVMAIIVGAVIIVFVSLLGILGLKITNTVISTVFVLVVIGILIWIVTDSK